MKVILKWVNDSESALQGYKPVLAHKVAKECLRELIYGRECFSLVQRKPSLANEQTLEIRIKYFGQAQDISRTIQNFLSKKYGIMVRATFQETNKSEEGQIDILTTKYMQERKRYRRMLENIHNLLNKTDCRTTERELLNVSLRLHRAIK